MVRLRRGEQIKVSMIFLPSFACCFGTWQEADQPMRRLCEVLVISFLEGLLLGVWHARAQHSPLLLLHWAVSKIGPENKHSPPTAPSWRELHISTLHLLHSTVPHTLGEVQFQTLVLIKKGGREVLEVLTALTLTNLCLWLPLHPSFASSISPLTPSEITRFLKQCVHELARKHQVFQELIGQSSWKGSPEVFQPSLPLKGGPAKECCSTPSQLEFWISDMEIPPSLHAFGCKRVFVYIFI